MTDMIWVISSCVLILAVIAVRAAFGKKLSAGLRYALWGLVLLRLLIPGTIGSGPASVSSAVSGAGVVKDVEAVKDYSAIARTESGAVIGQLKKPEAKPAAESKDAAEQKEPAVIKTAVVLQSSTPEQFARMKKTLALRDILNIVWYTGAAVTAACFIAANLRFYLRLRKRRERLDIEAGCPVYAVEGLSSSCLFLNSIYISKETAEDAEKLPFVLAHENAHRRHGDGVFALLRSAALALHWYDPLVWLAAFLSRRDSELAADAGAVKTLGEDARGDYGRALIELSARSPVYAPIACAATMMTSGGRELKSRVKSIACRRRTGFIAAALALVIAFAAVGCAFTGSKKQQEKDEPLLEAAWAEAQRIAEAHGLAPVKENNSIVTDRGLAAVTFHMPDKSSAEDEIRLTLTGSDKDEWLVTDRRLKLALMEEPDDNKLAADEKACVPFEITVTAEQLAEAGAEKSSDGAARLAGRALAVKLTDECPEDNYFKCTMAALTGKEKISSEPNVYTLEITVKPVNERVFYNAFSDSMIWLFADEYRPELMYCFTFRTYAEVREADGGYTVMLTKYHTPDWSGDSEGYSLDIDGDGKEDKVKLDLTALKDKGSAMPYLLLADGTIIELPAVSTSHAGMATYGIADIDGRDMLFYYKPSWYGGSCYDAYMLLTVENGELKTARSGGVEFEVSAVKPLDPVDENEVLAFVDEINEIWRHSRLIFSTDADIALKQMYSRETGLRVPFDGEFLIAPQDEHYYCVEQLERLDAEFGLAGYPRDAEYDARSRLEWANNIMAEHKRAYDNANEGVLAVWPIDADNDGAADLVKLDLAALASAETAPFIELSDGARIPLPYAVSMSHAGSGSYAAVKFGGRDCLLYTRSIWYGGQCGDQYSLFCVENGEISIIKEAHIEYEVSNGRPLPQLDKQAILDFIAELNGLWSSGGRLLFSTDWDITASQVYNADTGKRVEADHKAFVYSIEAERFGDTFFVPDLSGRYICREELQRFDREFAYDTENVTAELRIDTANRVMAETTAIYAAMEYLGEDDFSLASAEKAELASDGLWHITVRVGDKLVETVGGRVVGG